MTNSVCLVSRNEIGRAGLAHILHCDNFEVLHSGSNIASIPDSLLFKELLIIVDEPSFTDQILAVDLVKNRFHSAKIVILADRFDLVAMVSCFRAGADGYIVNATRSLPLLTALRLVSLGEKVMPSDLVAALENYQIPSLSLPRAPDQIAASNLSLRERDVLYCLMAGFPNKSIANKLGVCEATIKVHVKAILRKLKVNNRTEAAIWGNHCGLPDVKTSEVAFLPAAGNRVRYISR